MRPRGPVARPVSTSETFAPTTPAADATAKLTVRLTPELHKAVKRAALEQDVSIQDYVTRLLDDATSRAAE
ncbi:toxin-antitoxin system HicB family antitoxin [Rhodococcoides corynebacterioides]|uniref:toxin-antitoxin system HicB family antitoxin n=1 Tax=Rhodococcoides corynebacterioides TaxID=53972 RepID=UPI00353023E7